MIEHDVLAQLGVEIAHHFAAGTYAKQVKIPAGRKLVQHTHAFDHLSILASGHVIVEVDGERLDYFGPACLNIKSDAEHSVEAITDSVWFCIHAVDETDPDHIDEAIMSKVKTCHS